MSELEFEDWIACILAGDMPDLKPWERANLLEHVSSRRGDLADVARHLLGGPIPLFRLDDFLNAAAACGNERVAMLIIEAGATTLPLADACRQGLSELARVLIGRGARFNRRFASELAPIHLAASSANAAATTAVLIESACDLTVRTPEGLFAWDLAPADIGEEMRSSVGQHGPRWFREAQLADVDHFLFVREESMFGFNPNDVQAPILTGNEDEGFGWPNTVEQARVLLEDNRVLREELAWFAPFLDRIEAEEDFGLSDLGARVPRRREPSWR